ncbi:MAG: AMP-binding protein [Acidobacteria bacterium]|nr:AMP-binding protein [Acidobacteriota bacterium]MBV9476377.1 AMP-binding protein [Acidobacteriota bacterium]
MFDLDLLSERARVTPDRVALVSVATRSGTTSVRLTYAELNARAERAAGTLRAIGLEAGDRFGLLAHNSVEFLDYFFAAGKAGAIVVPLSTRATAHELAHIVADCGMKALVHGPEFDDVTAQLDVPRHSLHAPHEASFAGEARDPEDVYCLLYTSGTTGKPKGVMIPRRQLYWNAYNTAINWGLRDDDVSSIFTPLYHAGGIAAFLLPIFAVGGAIVLHRGFDATEVWRTIEQERCTVVLGVPTIWKMLMDAPEFASVDLSHVRWLISGGAPLPHFIIKAYQQRGVVFKQGYGMTEVGVNCFTMTVEDSYRKPGSIGRPMLFTEVRLENMDGEVGEMSIRGPHVSRGYWNNEEATRAAYGEDGFFRTGDLARRDEDGFFYIAGRRKEMFISGGVNVYPAEIEAELVSHPGVADAAVVAVPDDTWGEVAVAFVVSSASEAELTSYLTLRIAKYKVPKRFVFVEALPRTPYGKVVKETLRKTLA